METGRSRPAPCRCLTPALSYCLLATAARVFQTTDTAEALPKLQGMDAVLQVHPLQAASCDAVTREAAVSEDSRTFSVPALTAVVFVEPV